jgi:hypothetical protein
MNFVVDHVLEALVVGWAEKHLRLHLATRKAVVEHLIAVALIPCFPEIIGEFLAENKESHSREKTIMSAAKPK